MLKSIEELSIKPEELMQTQEAKGTTCTIGQGAKSRHNICFKKNIFPNGFWESYQPNEIAIQLLDSFKKVATLESSKRVPTLFTLLGDAQTGFIIASLGNCRCFLMGFDGDDALQYFEQLSAETVGSDSDSKQKIHFYEHTKIYENNKRFSSGILRVNTLIKSLPQIVKMQLLVLSSDFLHADQTPKFALRALTSCFNKLEKIPGLLSSHELTQSIYLHFEHQLGKMKQKAVIIQSLTGEKNSAPFMFTLCEGADNVLAAQRIILQSEQNLEHFLQTNSINLDVDSKTNKESNGKTKMHASTGGESSKRFFSIKKKTTSLPQISNGAKTSPTPGSSS